VTNFVTILLQINPGICMPKIIKTDLTKLLRKQKGCSFLPHSVFSLKHRTISVSEMYGICSNIAFRKLYQLVWRIMARE